MYEVIMPKLGLTMETGTIEKWHKKEGDKIEEGDILFDVMTDKVSQEVESYYSGILRKIIYHEGDEVPVTEVVAYIGSPDEKLPDLKNTEVSLTEIKKESTDEKTAEGYVADITKKNVQPLIVAKNVMDTTKKIKITPLAKKIARNLKIDYKTCGITGTGPKGRIVKNDIINFSKSTDFSKKTEVIAEYKEVGLKEYKNAEIESFKLSGKRKVIADKMVLAKQTIPHIIISAVADVTDLKILKEKSHKKFEEEFGIKLTFTDFVLKAVAMSLRKNIKLNSTLINDKATIYKDINIGLAVAAEDGLIVPTILRTDELSILEIAKKRIELVDKARNNKLQLGEITNGTFTVSNLGMYRVRSFTAIINPPQTSILSVSEIYKDIVIDDDNNFKTGYFMGISIAVDHRVIDGADAAKYIQTLVNYLENPFFVF